MSSKVKRTYGSSRSSRPCIPSSSPPQSTLTLSSSPPQKRPLTDHLHIKNTSPPPKRIRSSLNPKSKTKSNTTKQSQPKKKLTQLHFCLDTGSILRTCPLCDLSYTKGAPDDETLHRVHCARVQRGMEWGREEERENVNGKAGVEVVEVASGVRLKDGRKGRIISFRADATGKIGSKLTTLLETINLALSSPPLTPAILQKSKAYLFLLPSSTGTREREKIVGCVIAQRIATAMAIASAECVASQSPQSQSQSPSTSTSFSSDSSTASESTSSTPENPPPSLIPIDTSTGLFCHPTPLPTPLGIPRLFVPSTHRRQGIASKLLSAAAETFVHGCPFDPRRGEVAFTQPTGDGAGVMREWGGGGVRVYEE